MYTKKKERRTLIGVIAAGTAVIVLMIAGTILRMRSADMGFAAAFSSFLKDTFGAASK